MNEAREAAEPESGQDVDLQDGNERRERCRGRGQGKLRWRLPADRRPWMGMLLRRAHRRLDTILEELIAPSGLTRREFLVLAGAVFDGPASQRRISEKLEIDRSTMTEIVDRLEARSLVERLPDPDDRRAYRLTATEAGNRLIQEDYAHVPEEADKRLLEDLPTDDQETLRRLLLQVVGRPPWKQRDGYRAAPDTAPLPADESEAGETITPRGRPRGDPETPALPGGPPQASS